MNLIIKDIINTDLAVSMEDGDILFERIVAEINAGNSFTVDFDGLDLITTAFLSNAFGKLYSIYDSSLLNQHIKLLNLKNEDLELLVEVKNRVLNQKDSEFTGAWIEEFGNE